MICFTCMKRYGQLLFLDFRISKKSSPCSKSAQSRGTVRILQPKSWKIHSLRMKCYQAAASHSACQLQIIINRTYLSYLLPVTTCTISVSKQREQINNRLTH